MCSIKAGIIGLGIGEKHIDGYHRHPRCTVAGLCDFNPAKRAAARECFPQVKVVAEAAEILQDREINVVSIATYDNYHYKQVVMALEHGKHVFVEKPLCLYPHEAVHIRKLLNKRPQLHLSSNLILRLSPRFRRLKEMIDQQELGELFSLEGDYNYGRLHKITQGWRGKSGFYSVVYGGAVHLVDLMLWLSGRRVLEVSAYGNNIATHDTAFRYNDFVTAILKFDGGLIGKVTANFACVYPHFHRFSVYGTKGTFENGLREARFFKKREDQIIEKEFNIPSAGAHKGALIYSFLESILHGSPAEVETEDVFQTMSVCFAIEEAVKSGSPVKVEYI